jgi:hypothetical protein
MHKNKLLFGVALAFVSLSLAAVINFPKDAQAQARHFGFGSATSTAAAATIDQTAGVVTTEALTTAALTDYTFTLTNATISANSVVLASVAFGTSTTGDPVVGRITPAAGSVVIIVRNSHATAALNGTIKIRFAVLTP